MEKLRVSFQSNGLTVSSQNLWVADSNTLSVAFSYEPSPVPSPLAEKILADVGVKPKIYRLLVDDVDIILNAQGNITSIDLYTNPQKWQVMALAPLPAMSRLSRVTFDVSFDELNNDYRVRTAYSLCWDPASREFAIRLAGVQAKRWYSLSTLVAFGVDDKMNLGEIRLASIDHLPI